jgi:putative ABC transport system permease protein
MAIGARDRDIRVQFLIEAVLLGLAGAAFGIVLGTIASALLSSWLGWRTVVSGEAVLVAALFAVTVGLVFGYVPASRAAALTPIDALRNE